MSSETVNDTSATVLSTTWPFIIARTFFETFASGFLGPLFFRDLGAGFFKAGLLPCAGG